MHAAYLIVLTLNSCSYQLFRKISLHRSYRGFTLNWTIVISATQTNMKIIANFILNDFIQFPISCNFGNDLSVLYSTSIYTVPFQ